jgi:hypothetical protein
MIVCPWLAAFGYAVGGWLGAAMLLGQNELPGFGDAQAVFLPFM